MHFPNLADRSCEDVYKTKARLGRAQTETNQDEPALLVASHPLHGLDFISLNARNANEYNPRQKGLKRPNP